MSDCCPPVEAGNDKIATVESCCTKENGSAQPHHCPICGQKVCYCFRHNPVSIRAELLATGASTVIEKINGGIQAGQCACEVRNPQGSCCLGNVSRVVKQIEQEVKMFA